MVRRFFALEKHRRTVQVPTQAAPASLAHEKLKPLAGLRFSMRTVLDAVGTKIRENSECIFIPEL